MKVAKLIKRKLEEIKRQQELRLPKVYPILDDDWYVKIQDSTEKSESDTEPLCFYSPKESAKLPRVIENDTPCRDNSEFTFTYYLSESSHPVQLNTGHDIHEERKMQINKLAYENL